MTKLEKCHKSLEMSYFFARKFNRTKNKEDMESALNLFNMARSYGNLNNNALTMLYKYINGFPINPNMN